MSHLRAKGHVPPRRTYDAGYSHARRPERILPCAPQPYTPNTTTMDNALTRFVRLSGDRELRFFDDSCRWDWVSTSIHWILFELGYPPALLPARRRHRPPFVLTAARALCMQAGAFESSTRERFPRRDTIRRHAVRNLVLFWHCAISVGPISEKAVCW